MTARLRGNDTEGLLTKVHSEMLRDLYEFNKINRQVNLDEGMSVAEAEQRYNALENFIDQYGNWIDLPKVKELIKQERAKLNERTTSST